MIVPMKKASIIVTDSMRLKTLEKLGNLGVLHVEIEKPEGLEETETLAELYHKRGNLEHCLQLFPPEVKKESSGESLTVEEVLENAEELLRVQNEKKQLDDTLDKYRREEERLEAWGDFDPSAIQELNDKGIHIRLLETTREAWEKMEEEIKEETEEKEDSRFLLEAGKNKVRAVSVYLYQPPENEEGWFSLPEMGLDQIRVSKKKIKEKISECDKKIMEEAKKAEFYSMALEYVNRIIDFEEINLGMEKDGTLCFLTGFVPVNQVNDLEKTAKKESWGLLLQEPGDKDRVPTKVKNPKAVSIIEPVFKLLGTVPGYKEYDISFFFLVFFSIFFAMIIGDGGYGFVLLIVSFLAMISGRKKTGKTDRGIILLFLLSSCTIIWGAVTGTWFGSKTIVENSFLSVFIVPVLYSFNPESSETIKFICFILGTVQISIAHIWNFFTQLKKAPLIKAFAQLGWLSMVLGLFYLVLNIVLSPQQYPMPDFALYMIGVGLIFVILFSNQEGNFFKGIGKGIANIITTLLDGISAFSDIISYIRLFAVGLATVEIAKSFNQMSADLSTGVVGIIAGILILLLGHTMNLLMGALSVIVHGVRLNMLEFSGHLGMEWTGIPYKPFIYDKKNEQKETL